MKILVINKHIKNTSYKKEYWVPIVENGPSFKFSISPHLEAENQNWPRL